MSATTTIQVTMPKLGDSVTEGTVLEWHKAEGDRIDLDETIVEISTDKVDTEIPSPASGTVVKIHAAEGEAVEVGALLAEIAPDGGAPTEGTPSAGSSSDEGGNGSAQTEETVVEIVMPHMGESVQEGTVLEWHKQPGDTVTTDETVVEVSTDKVDAEVPSPGSGTITELLVQEGDTVTVGQPLARMLSGGTSNGKASPNGGDPQTAPQATAASRAGTAQQVQQPDGKKASPVALRAASEQGVDLSGVAGSGLGGRITKADVLAAAKSGGNGKVAAAPSGAEQMKGASAVLARYMDESRSIPTATSFRTITVTTLDGRRKQLKEGGQRVSFTHLIGYAIAKAAGRMEVMTHHYDELDGKPYKVVDGQVNLGLAVDVERKDGSRTLMVPVIKGCDTLSFSEYLAAYNALVDKARENKLAADDLMGANVTLTNPGGIGTIASVPRLMKGQGTIVATGSIAYPVGLGEVGAAIGAEKVMTLTSTYDHRVIQGAESGRFLAEVEAYLQGENDFYEEVFADLGVQLGPTPAKPKPSLSQVAPSQPIAPGAQPDEQLLQAVQAATLLVQVHRTHGHLAAQLDPLGSQPEDDPMLNPETLGLNQELMERIPAAILQTYFEGSETLADMLPKLKETYCGPIAYEIEHISSHKQRAWLREKIESGQFRKPLGEQEQRDILERLNRVDSFERFLHKAYLGQKQFSIEGLDITVPIVDWLIAESAERETKEIVIGMAHRGRLNVLAHNLRRPYETIFAEFEGVSTLEAVTTIPQGGTGDVKYHHGYKSSQQTDEDSSIVVRLESNPSHLEFVSPVALGATRAVQTTHRDQSRAGHNTDLAIPVAIHGDASFPGQGVVSETLNLQTLDGYTVGGTIHLIMNNQVGFTTDPDDARSTRWASDLAKGFDVPIIHVNADDVEACMTAVKLAFAFRQEFGHDVVIDIIGYRRFGHNEADEPSYTQPGIYNKIKKHPRVCDIFAEQLIAKGVVSEQEVEQQKQAIWEELSALHRELKEQIETGTAGEHSTGEYQLDRSPSPQIDTAVPTEKLRELGQQLLTVPEGFEVHPKLKPQLERRRKALEEGTWIDWAHAESLAFASLLNEGIPVRLTGQDTERGTFSQRHMVLHDAKSGHEICPIQNLPEATAPMEVHNSPLSEVAALGFEYGYSQEAPDSLVLWEAQFGDFVNVAQVIVDQFIVSGLAKWGQTTRLTLLLPHGYEGSGPEHSSARLERFLQLAAEGNIRVAYPTTPAQYFHLLRRQAKILKRRPLIVMTPKSLLRLKQATNRIEHLSESRFHPVLPEPRIDVQQTTRLILCTGKIYYDLVSHPSRAEGGSRVAIGRVELLYPFPEAQIRELIATYPNLQEVLWVQEEPRNMGARAHMSPRLMQIMPEHLEFGYIGRPERASSGEGYPVAHEQEQTRILRTALDLSTPISMYPAKTPGQR